MIERIGRKKYSIYAFDIESHNDEESIAKMETSMWLGAFINEKSKIDDEESYLYTMSDFLDRLEKLTNPKRSKNKNESRAIKNIAIYIYNLSFEWSFILPELIKKGFKWVERINDNTEYSYTSISTKSVSSVWTVKIKFNKNAGSIILIDLAKIFGGGLGKVAKSFKLETQKGEIDYRLNRLHGHIVTKEEKEYCFKDTRIIIDILLKMQEAGNKYFFNSISMASYSMKMMFDFTWPREYHKMKKYREIYPELGQKETDFLRETVGGGICYVPALWQYKEIDQKVLHIDAHQMHPSQMANRFFPYGFGEYFKGEPPRGKICACKIKVSYSAVKLHSIIKLINIDFIDDFEITVWNFEIPTMKKCYVDLEIEYIEGYAYNYKTLPFKNYIKNNWRLRQEAKARQDDYNYLYHKLLNNSAYGKFLERPHNQLFANYIREDGIIDSTVLDKAEQVVNAKYTYLGIGSCIPAWSRVQLIETALLFDWKKVVYFDTDSIFVICDDDTMRVWNTQINQKNELGGWGLEEISDRSMFSAPKRYKLETGGNLTLKAGGVNFEYYKKEKADNLNIDVKDVIISFDEINIISSKWKVQRAFRCKGGTIIDFQEKEMDIPKKYQNIYKNNIIDNQVN